MKKNSNSKLKEADIVNRRSYYLDDIININDLNFGHISLNE